MLAKLRALRSATIHLDWARPCRIERIIWIYCIIPGIWLPKASWRTSTLSIAFQNGRAVVLCIICLCTDDLQDIAMLSMETKKWMCREVDTVILYLPSPIQAKKLVHKPSLVSLKQIEAPGITIISWLPEVDGGCSRPITTCTSYLTLCIQYILFMWCWQMSLRTAYGAPQILFKTRCWRDYLMCYHRPFLRHSKSD